MGWLGMCSLMWVTAVQLLSHRAVHAAPMGHLAAEVKSTIGKVFKKIDLENDDINLLERLLFVYPWTRRFFSISFENLSKPSGDSNVQAHGKKVQGAINNAVHHLDSSKATLHDLSDSHANKLHIDPANFRRFFELLEISLDTEPGCAFTPSIE